MHMRTKIPAVLGALGALLLPALVEAQDAMSRWGTVGPPSGWSFVSGKFSGDNRTDVLGYHPSNGSLWVGQNNNGGFTFSHWFTAGPAAGWTFLAGDFTGDGKADVFGYHPSNGTLWVGTNTGSTFVFNQPRTLSPVAGWRFVVADFTADGRADVIGQHPSNGLLKLFTTSGTPPVFTESQVGQTVAPHDNWNFVAGDFLGTSRNDLVGYRSSDGAVFWAENRRGFIPPEPFVFSQVHTAGPASQWSFVSGNFDGAGKDDLIGQHPSNGILFLGANTGHTFAWSDFSARIITSPNSGWSLVSGSFAGDSRTDVVGYQSCNGGLWLIRLGNPASRMEGYSWPLSAAPGQSIAFKVSVTGSGNSGTVNFVRHRATSCGVESIPMGQTTFTPAMQTTAENADVSGTGWSTSFTLSIPTSGWPSGIYSARLTNRQGEHTHVPFIVKTPVAQRSGLAVIANVNTWLAYNTWKKPGEDGRGKYGGLAQVSFQRPHPHASPVSGALHLTRGELWILTWLEDQGFSPDVFTDIDFHNGEVTSPLYKAVVLSTHPEYWTVGMEDRLKAILNSCTGSVLYLGANGIYEMGDYINGQQHMRFRGGNVHDAFGDLGSRERYLFRVNPDLAERPLLGLATTRCGVAGTDYIVTAAGASHFLLAGTGLGTGSHVGTSGLNFGWSGSNGKAAGWETDRATGATGEEVKEPGNCGWEGADPQFFNPDLPVGHTVLATFPAGSDGAEMTHYRTCNETGEFVFSVGSITFGGSLIIDPVLQKIVRNAVTAAGVVSTPP